MPAALQLGLDSVLKCIWISPSPHLLSKCICSESWYQQALNQHTGHNPLTSVVPSVCSLIVVSNPVFILSSTSVCMLYFICCSVSLLCFFGVFFVCFCFLSIYLDCREGMHYCEELCSFRLDQTAWHKHPNDAPNLHFFCHCSVSKEIDSDKIPWVLSAMNGKEQLNPM